MYGLGKLVSSAQELLASELLQKELVNLRVRSKDSAHASRRTDHDWKHIDIYIYLSLVEASNFVQT